MKRLFGLVVVAAVSVGWMVAAPPVAFAEETPTESEVTTCELGNGVKHVVNVVFDNTHFARDNPNVPSDLEQMPHLLNFIKGKGTLLTNEHTPLISHTATDILTTLTGVYGDRMGVPVSNSFRYFNPNGTSSLGVSFAYWTSPIFDPITTPFANQTDKTFNMLTAEGKNAPAPWVPFTRAGCNVGGVATANIELENTGIDIPTVFGPNSPEAADPDPTGSFVGIAVHCAQGAALCSTANHGRPDLLPDEPGGYTGYQALFGHKYVAPVLGGISAIDGTPIPAFPGFSEMPANTALGYVAKMQEHGVPVTYAYISDAHAGHGQFADRPFGPGEADYVAQLKQYDQAFAGFFTNLAAHGITRANTLFTFTSDEGDHLAAGPPAPANCDGVHVPCTYPKFGEVAVNLAGLIATQKGITTPFRVHSDMAPTIYITGNPLHTASVTRKLERAAGTITAVNPYSGKPERVGNYLADRAEMRLLHMLTSDRQRDPTFTMFAKPDYFLFAGAPNCSQPCVSISPDFNWIHGGIAPEVNTTWLGLVGPYVKHLGTYNKVWSDHADIRPTVLALTDLKDDYAHQGRPITEVIAGLGEDGNGSDLQRLAALYKKINAPVGQLSLDSVKFATKAMLSSSASDQTYIAADARIAVWTVHRDTLAAKIILLLDNTAPSRSDSDSDSGSDDADARGLAAQAVSLLAEVHRATA